MGVLIGCEQISHEWPGKTVLKDETIAINEGERIGVVGRNGDGKSTLLSILARSLVPTAGAITWRNGISVGLLAQHDSLDEDDIAIHAVMGSTPEYIWAADPKIRAIMAELLADVSQDARVGDLSGGQRRRIDLARVLVQPWDVLLMDEPTNHLDMQAIRWLAAHLKDRWPVGRGALLVVTHDRWFLDEVCEQMWEVHDATIDPFEGGYSAYIQQRVEREHQAAASEERRQNILRKELNWLAHGAKARSSKPKFRIEAARSLLAEDPPLRDSIELKRLAVARLGKQVIELKDVDIAYGDKAILSDVTWAVGPGDRVGILGANGTGKSSLLRVMCARQRPTSGFVKIGKTVHFGIMSQQLDGLSAHNDERLEELLGSFRQTYYIDGKPQSPTQLAERLGFSRSELPDFVGDLSGGQRRRLALLCVLLAEPNVLVLDEPGNDLDTDMLATVEGLLDEWPGTLLLVTHDRYLMERVTDDQYALLDGHLRHCPGGIEEYLRLYDEQTKEKKQQQSDASSIKSASGEEGSAALTNKERRELKKRFDAVERKLSKQRDVPPELEAEMASHDPTDYAGLLALQAQVDEARQEVSTLEDQWLELAERLGLE
jgi:ATPase subunit of ABC transporter with duplicated ATPase domains